MNMNEAELRAEVERLTAANHRLSTHLISMSDTLQASAREIAAKAWDEGRATTALDLTKEADKNGIYEFSPNPYRKLMKPNETAA